MNIKTWFVSVMALCVLASAGCSSSGGGGEEEDVTFGDLWSDDLDMKADGVSAAPPLSINPESPASSGSVTVTTTISGATSTITFTATGSGCGTIASTSGVSPLTVTGTAGSSGYCDLTASATVGSSTQTYQGSFSVMATDPNIAPMSLVSGMWKSASFPDATTTTGTPVITSVDGPAVVMNGSTNSFTIAYTGDQNVAGVLLQVDGYSNGYFFVPASGGSGVATFDLNVASDYFDQVNASISPGKSLRTGAQNLIISIIDVLNRISAQFSKSLATQESGTGDVKVSISWNTICDVDLHVTEPDGNVIWYSNMGPSSTGGQLDVDSNVGCGSGGGVENIFWPEGGSPQGAFGIKVHMYKSECPTSEDNISSTNVTLTYIGCGEEFKNGAKTESFTLGSTGDQQTFSFNSLCSYRVAGTVKYEDFAVTDTGLAAAGAMIPVRHATVKVLRTSDDTVLGEGVTGANGTYDIPFTNDGEHGYYVQVYAQSDTATLKQEARNLTGSLYAFRSATEVDESVEPNKTSFDIEVKKTDNAGALNIWDVGISSNAYARTAIGSTPPKLVFYWTSGQKPNGKDASFYTTDSSGNPAIAVLGDASDSDDYDDVVLGHEYGHFVHAQFGTSDSPGGGHSSNNQVDPRLAFSEGWATFFAMASQSRSMYIDTDAAGVGVSYSIETPPAGKPLGNAGAALNGNLSEAIVAAALYDLYDKNNETKDTLDSKTSAIFTILTTYLKSGYAKFADRGVAGRDLVDFLDGWFCLGYENKGDDDENGVRGNAVGLHQLSYDFTNLASCK